MQDRIIRLFIFGSKQNHGKHLSAYVTTVLLSTHSRRNCFNKMALHFSHVTRPERGLREAGKAMAPTQCQPLTTEYFFFFCRDLKKKVVCVDEIRDLRHLWQRIIRNIATVTREMLQQTQQDTEYRLMFAHFESFTVCINFFWVDQHVTTNPISTALCLLKVLSRI
jgi:hypothetical protein